MPGSDFLALVAIFFLTSVVTGSTSLLTVHALLGLGIEARTAIATNMAALTLISVGAVLPFVGHHVIARERLIPAAILTIGGSVVGALLLAPAPCDMATAHLHRGGPIFSPSIS